MVSQAFSPLYLKRIKIITIWFAKELQTQLYEKSNSLDTFCMALKLCSS